MPQIKSLSKIKIMQTLSQEQKSNLIKTQAILTKIANKQPCFFNIVVFRDRLGLVKEHGTTTNNTTNWCLTEKGKMLLNTQL